MFHVLTSSIFALLFMILTFIGDNIFFTLELLTLCICIFLSLGEYAKMLKGLIYFIPLFLITLLINIFFSNNGVIYAVSLSSKLLLVIYIFMLIDIMIDSDSAVSYFMTKIPKTALMFIISFKIVPNLKERLKRVKEVYTIRGIDFETKGVKEKIKCFIPVLSILLESCLEESFDIAESSYCRGFLSSKRTSYEKVPLNIFDFLLIITMVLFTLISAIFIQKRNYYSLVFIVTIIFIINIRKKMQGDKNEAD